MDEEKLKSLFSIETNTSSVGTNKEKGTGLGLIICKEFAEQQNGKLEVTSTPGKGTTFIIKFPVA